MAILQQRTDETLERLALDFYGPQGTLLGVSSFGTDRFPFRFEGSRPYLFWYKQVDKVKLSISLSHSFGVAVGAEGVRQDWSGAGSDIKTLVYAQTFDTGKGPRRNFSQGIFEDKQIGCTFIIDDLSIRTRQWDDEGELIFDNTVESANFNMSLFSSFDESVQFKLEGGNYVFAPAFEFDGAGLTSNPDSLSEPESVNAPLSVELFGDPVNLYAEDANNFSGSSSFAIEIEETF